MYPKWFFPVVADLFRQQEGFYHALLAHKKLCEADLARLLVYLRFPGVKAADIQACEVKRPDSDAKVGAVTGNEIDAALEVVDFFSAPKNIRMDTATLIRKFKPKNGKGQGMAE